MRGHTWWLWLSAGWLMTWLTEAVINPGPGSTSICDLGPCSCSRGRLHCDCSLSKIKDIRLKDLEAGSLSAISVVGCVSVSVGARALSHQPGLRSVSVSRVERLFLEEQAFSWQHPGGGGGLVVNLTDCGVPEVPSYCFRGSLRDVLLTRVHVLRVRAFAFASIDHAEKLEFSSVRFGEVESQAFKKFSVDVLSVSDSNFTVLPTRTMIDVEVHDEVRFENVYVDTIESSALKLHGMKHFRLARSTIAHVEHAAFHVHGRGSVVILDNAFPHVEKGAFVGFTVERRFLQEFGKQELVFENNTLTDFESAPLMFNTTGFSPRLDAIVVAQQCSCPDADYWTSDLVYFSSTPREVTRAPHVASVLYCLRSPGPGVSNVRDYQRVSCRAEDPGVLQGLALVSASVLTLSALVMLAYCGLQRRARRYTNVPDSPSPLKQGKGHVLVVPDAKTYRETELHVIVEHVEPIVHSEYARAS